MYKKYIYDGYEVVHCKWMKLIRKNAICKDVVDKFVVVVDSLFFGGEKYFAVTWSQMQHARKRKCHLKCQRTLFTLNMLLI